MKILYFDTGITTGVKRLNTDLILLLTDYCDLVVRYPKDGRPDLQMIEKIKPDILLYPERHFSRQIPQFLNINIKKVMIEMDMLYYFDSLDWFIDNKFNIVINRGPGDSKLLPFNSVFMPLSVGDEFYPSTTKQINKIAFVGGGRYSSNIYYKTRSKAINILEKNGLIDYYGDIGYNLYPDILRSYKCCLACTMPHIYKLPAKIFEIFASDSILLSTKSIYYKEMKFSNSDYVEYNEDLSDIVDKAKYILLSQKINSNAYNIIETYHRHKHRVKELYDILYAVYINKDVPKIWGE